MSERSLARHRAPARPLTPLDSISDTLTGQLSAVSGQLSTVGRSGAVIAVSTGLVATMGLPASAVTKTAPENSVALSRPSVVAAAAVALPASVVSGAAVTALATANVSFERSTIVAKKAAPKPKPKPKARVAERTSRSTARSVTVAPKASAVKSAKKKKQQQTASDSVDTSSVLSVARGLLGIPYVYGGTTPDGFDCSGFTKYVFGKVGISLPRTSAAQYSASTRISRSQANPGDLVFIFSGGRVTHVGIYTGGNRMIDSPRSGKSTQEREIWSSNIAFGRP